jgi:hypothetical protein
LDGSQLALIALVLAGLTAVVVPFVFRAPGRALRKRFIALGTLKGKTRKEIVKAVGEPGTETPLPDGRTLLQWRATGYPSRSCSSRTGCAWRYPRVRATSHRGISSPHP